MLMYAAKKAANPYGGAGTPTGPAVTSPGDQTTVIGDAVQLTVKASGGSTPYSWSATGLPAGLSLASDTGVISGKPTTAGTAKVAVTVKDANGKTGSTSFNWTVTDKSAATVTVTNPGNQWGFTGFAMNLQIKASSSDGAALTFSGTGLPPGVTISTSGLISGAPTARGTYSVTVTAKTAGGSSGSATFSIQVY